MFKVAGCHARPTGPRGRAQHLALPLRRASQFAAAAACRLARLTVILGVSAAWAWRKLGRDGRLMVAMISAFPALDGLQGAGIYPRGRGVLAFSSLAVIFSCAAALNIVRRYDRWLWRTQHGIRAGRVVASQVDGNSARLDAVEDKTAKLGACVDEILAIMAEVDADVSPAAKTRPQFFIVRDGRYDEAS